MATPTAKQSRMIRSDSVSNILDLLINLDLSIGILEDARTDLKAELSDMNKTLTRSKRKYQEISKIYTSITGTTVKSIREK